MNFQLKEACPLCAEEFCCISGLRCHLSFPECKNASAITDEERCVLVSMLDMSVSCILQKHVETMRKLHEEKEKTTECTNEVAYLKNRVSCLRAELEQTKQCSSSNTQPGCTDNHTIHLDNSTTNITFNIPGCKDHNNN